MGIKLAVFDMAGTTVKDKNYVHKAFVDAFEKGGFKTTEEQVNPLMGYPKPIAIKKVLDDNKEAYTEADIKVIHDQFVRNMVEFYQTDASVKEEEGVRETFTALHNKGIKIAIDTGFSRDIMDVIIDRLGWKKDNLIDFSVASDEVTQGRPYPDMIFKAMEHFGVEDSQSVIKIGDTSSDMQQGDAAKCGMVIGITTGAFTEETFKPYPYTHIIHALPELIPLLK
ncbi:phosphonatase-like hydrolase [Limibacter armeniacum]|uniref:phosphonatase-like hydrolase n=1 Tax=Limibacter armeniacum TaxID=466084 RepID=UPI002FE550C4